MATHWDVGSQDPSVVCPEQSRCHWPLNVTSQAQWCARTSSPVWKFCLISADLTATAPEPVCCQASVMASDREIPVPGRSSDWTPSSATKMTTEDPPRRSSIHFLENRAPADAIG